MIRSPGKPLFSYENYSCSCVFRKGSNSGQYSVVNTPKKLKIKYCGLASAPGNTDTNSGERENNR